jgi:hypothetical protein
VPAPPTCRHCGATLPPSVRWCGLCQEPVLEFSPREPVHAGTYVGNVRVEARYSRWRASPTTFGPVGRVLATLAVILMGPWTGISMFSILYMPVWIMLATMSLKQVWARQKVDPDAPPTRVDRFRERHPLLAYRIDLPLIFAGIGLLLLVVAALALTGTGVLLLVLASIFVGGGALLAWLAGI